jgi:dTMP kinase
MMIPGRFFITLEGIEGCGKSTQTPLLVEWLKSKGYEVTVTREPGGTAIGKRIRAILLDPESRGITGLSELLLYSADRAQHISEVIEPALSAGGVVVCDRYSDATAAYQGYGRGQDLELIAGVGEFATRGLMPDLTLLLDLPVEAGLSRAISRNDANGAHREARFEQEAVEFHERVRKGYLEIACNDPARVKVIDASGGVEEVSRLVLKAVDYAIAGAGSQEA